MAKAMKDYDSDWKNGMPVNASVLKNVTRESVEKDLIQNGNMFALKGVDILV